MCVALWAKTHSPSVKGIARMYSINRYTFVSAMKGGARKWIHCAQSAFARKVFILYSKTYNKGRNTVISPEPRPPKYE